MTYSHALDHSSMVFDHVRNEAYEKAIRENITEDSIVLDLGCGLGLHGLMAARAGAKKVYLVDPSPAVLVAEKVARANGLDNVECIKGRIEDLAIEKVDMIISVFTGNFLLTEDLLPSLFFARDKFLKPGGLLLPDRAKMLVAPIESSAAFRLAVERWSATSKNSLVQRFGVSYAELDSIARNSLTYDDFSKTELTELTGEQVLMELDFYQAKKAECFRSIETLAKVSGKMNGWLGWFDMLLGEKWLSTSPKSERLHWRQVYFPAFSVDKVSVGDRLYFDIKRPEFGEWSWSMANLQSAESFQQSGMKPKKQSTFLANNMNFGDIQKKSESYRPRLSEHGEILAKALQLSDGSKTNSEIAECILIEFPSKFLDKDSALRYVQAQAALLR